MPLLFCYKRISPLLLIMSVGFSVFANAELEPGDEGYIPPIIPDQLQTTPPAVTPESSSTITYPADYFLQYQPISARDMLNRIPGIDSIIGPPGSNNDDRRGLGAGGSQILINSKRLAGKQNDGRSVLGQIAASQVKHIEIIRGTSSELDIRSTGPIVNVVLRDDASKATVTAEIGADYYQHDGNVEPGAVFSINGRGNRLNYLATLEADPQYEREYRNELSVLGDGSTKDRTFEDRVREQTDYTLSTTVGLQATEADLLQVNALFEKNDPPRDVEREILVLDPNDERLLVPGTQQLISQFDDNSAERHKWEFGTNYVHDFNFGGQFKFILIANEEIDNSLLNRTSDEDGSIATILYIDEKRRSREKIIRSSVNFPLMAGQDLEVGLEGAQTTLDSWFLLSLDDDLSNNTPTASDIEEMRYEPFVVHNWQLSPNIALESSLVAEFSEITFNDHGLNDGAPVSPEVRDFTFWKPKIDFRYDINPSLQFRTTIARDISQLDFRDFTARQDMDLDSTSDSGNPDLVQEKSWQYEFNLEYRLPNDGGVIDGRIFYHDIEDVIDRVDATSYYDNSTNPPTPIPAEELEPTSTPGNIGNGEKMGLELNSSIRLGFFDLPEALLTAGVLLRDSEVTDPFTGEERRFSGTPNGRGNWNVGFRHDVTQWNFSYGFTYRYHLGDANRRIDVDDIRDFEQDPNSSVFLEKVAFDGIRFRLDVINALGRETCLRRTRFDGFTADGDVEEVEDSCVSFGRKFTLKVRTTF